MTKKINKFFEAVKKISSGKGFLITFSIVCGIVAWLFVLDAKNPVTERTIAVELEFLNFEEPAENNLTLVSELGVISANIKISGREDIVNNVIPSDLSLKVDFSKVKEKGTSYITVDAPECEKIGVKVLDYYPKEIAVTSPPVFVIKRPIKRRVLSPSTPPPAPFSDTSTLIYSRFSIADSKSLMGTWSGSAITDTIS